MSIAIAELKEVNYDDLDRLFDASVRVVTSDCSQFIEVHRVKSGDAIYTVRRFYHFADCNCAAGNHGQLCKHVAAVMPSLCIACRTRPAHTRGGYCEDHAPRQKVGSGRKPERFGSIRI